MPEFGPFHVNDAPAASLLWEILTEDDLSGYTSATAELVNPDGEVTAEPAVTFEPNEDEDGYLFEIAALGDAFDVEGIYSLRVTLTGPGGVTLRLEPLRTVAQDETSGWHTLDTARAEAGKTFGNHVIKTWQALNIARRAVLKLAPALGEDEAVPDHWRQAQLLHATDVWNAAKATSGSEDEFVLRPVPMSWTVKAILRPRKGVPNVG